MCVDGNRIYIVRCRYCGGLAIRHNLAGNEKYTHTHTNLMDDLVNMANLKELNRSSNLLRALINTRMFLLALQAPVEDEWREFEEEERKDYSGLKIGQLQIDDDEPGNVEDATDKYDSDGELTTDPDRQQSGPWNKVDSTKPVAAPVVAPEPAPVVNSTYVSPGMRNFKVCNPHPHTTNIRQKINNVFAIVRI